ncbi:XRE family transcriptional regulator [Streptomyces sp. NPDC056683]|uniref:XRE family transcriptional regulator n=1 Tax=Streptomyces sp. NPDC056683 TaxID=3345910 RepID=UPI0036C51A64
MAETKNHALAAWMKRTKTTAPELSEAVNEAIQDLTGRPGSVSERTVFRWLSGEHQWPQTVQRHALETVTGSAITALGFVPRGKRATAPAPPPEDPPVHRRRFVGAAAGTVASAAVPLLATSGPPARVGTSDVIRLRESIQNLISLDADRGGHTALERASLAGAAEALELQQRATSQRVRARLYSLASDFTATAAWSAIDAGRLDDVDRHLDRALALAGMAQDGEMTMQAWNLRAMLARQRKNYGEAIAAARAAQTGIARRSRLHASLAHARTAIGLAHAGEHRAALRSIGRAEDTLAQADTSEPPATWVAFYGAAELHSITAIVCDVIGQPAQSEAAAHRALAALPDTYRRNRAYTTARLALAQLHQGDVDQAYATSTEVFDILGAEPLRGRVRQLLGDFQRDLITTAPPRIAHEWADRFRTEWSSA